MASANLSASRSDHLRVPVSPVTRSGNCGSGAQLRSHRAARQGVCEATAWVTDEPSRELVLEVLEGAVDDPQLANPLQRMHRLGTGWFGVIFELEGVLVEDASDDHKRAWLELVEREGRARPPVWALKRAEGMKAEQVITEVLCLTRIPEQVRRLAREKEDIFVRLQADRKPVVMPGVVSLLETLSKYDIPVALATSEPEARVHAALDRIGLRSAFCSIITGADVSRGRPDPEPYLLAAYDLARPPLRCVLVGNSNLSIEAAHEVGMQCVAVATRHPMFELNASDLVVRSLEDVSVQNLKQLFRQEKGVPPLERELQPETQQAQRPTMFMD